MLPIFSAPENTKQRLRSRPVYMFLSVRVCLCVADRKHKHYGPCLCLTGTRIYCTTTRLRICFACSCVGGDGPYDLTVMKLRHFSETETFAETHMSRHETTLD